MTTPRPFVFRLLGAARLSLALCCLGLAGCSAHRGQQYHDKQMDFGSITSVAVMPFSNLSRDTLAAERVRDVFATMLLSSGAIYVVPNGEVARALAKSAVATPTAPNVDDVIKLGTALKVEGVITGVVKEYGEVRSGSATGNVVSVSVQLLETTTGKVVWSASSTKGGVTFADRLLGGGGTPLNDVTELAVDDLIEKLFK